MRRLGPAGWLLAAALAAAWLLGAVAPAPAAGADDYTAAKQAMDGGQWDRAINLYTRALGSGGLSAERRSTAYNNRGVCWANKGDRRRAVQDYGLAIKENPQNDRAYTNRGLSHGILGDYASALADHQKALALRERKMEVPAGR